jgi:hypothetical protein
MGLCAPSALEHRQSESGRWDIAGCPLWVAISEKFAGILEANDCLRIDMKGAIYR